MALNEELYRSMKLSMYGDAGGKYLLTMQASKYVINVFIPRLFKDEVSTV
jgi:hypothetical protein